MNNPTTTGEAFARTTDPATSHEAADSLKEAGASELEKKVYEAIHSTGINGATGHEIVALTGLPWSSATPRLAPLRRKGLIRPTFPRRPGPSGRACIVWVAVGFLPTPFRDGN
jgi:hypothetical protein